MITSDNTNVNYVGDGAPVVVAIDPNFEALPAISNTYLGACRANHLVGFNDGDPVDVFPDQSFYHNDLLASGATRPIYKTNTLSGFPSLLFDGVDDIMLSAGMNGVATAPLSLFVICNYTKGSTFANRSGLVGGDAATGGEGIVGVEQSTTLNMANVVEGHMIDNIAQIDMAPLEEFHTIFAEGLTVLDYATGWQLGRDRLNSSRHWAGNILEVFLIDGVVSPADKQVLYDYAQAKYGTFPIGNIVQTPITNLLNDPFDFTAGWSFAGTPIVTNSNITWTDGTGADRIRDQWYTLTQNDDLLFILRATAPNLNGPSGTSYYANTAIRYYDETLGNFVLEDRFTKQSHSPRFRNEATMRNYSSRFTAQQGRVMFDLNDMNWNDAGVQINYELAGLYTIQGLTGEIYDPASDVRYNLDAQITWWGDSISALNAFYMADWLNIINANDRGVGGEDSFQILARFNAEPAIHATPTLIMSGHNDIGTATTAVQIQNNIKEMTDALDILGTDYRVLTLTANELWTNPSTGYTKREDVSNWILTTYGAKALDVYAFLRTIGDGGVDDNADIAAGVIPRSIRLDQIHLNDVGNDQFLDFIFQSIDMPGWRG